MSSPFAATEQNTYTSLFVECLDELDVFLQKLFKSVFSDWQGTYTIVPYGRPAEHRVYEDQSALAPLCAALRDDLGLRDECYDCDARACARAAEEGRPVQYWCDWGLREIAVPILVHGVSVGTILCGQKRLSGPDDQIGLQRLQSKLDSLGLASLFPDLAVKRDLCEEVSADELDKLAILLSATSSFISQYVYTKLPSDAADFRSEAVRTYVTELSHAYSDLSANATTVQHFWTGFEPLLGKLAHLLDAQSIVALLSDNTGQAAQVAAYNFPAQCAKSYEEAAIITSQHDAFDGPQYLQISQHSEHPLCPVCACALAHDPTLDAALVQRTRLGTDRALHLIALFNSTLPRMVGLFLHLKKQVFSEFMSEAVPALVGIERIEHLRDAMKKQDIFLSDVSHQINQPIHGLVADCDNLLDPDFPSDRKARIIKYLPARAKQISMLARCVEYASRGESNIFRDLRLDEVSTPLTKVLIDNAINLQGYSEEQQLRIAVQSDKTDSFGNLLIDKEQFSLAITNVLYNAVKYSFPAKTITLSGEATDDKVIVTCTNYGIGIPTEAWQRIFSRNLRLRVARQFSQSGLGIGLFVTRELMRKMGGDAFVVESTPTGNKFKRFEEHRTVIGLSLPADLMVRQEGRTL